MKKRRNEERNCLRFGGNCFCLAVTVSECNVGEDSNCELSILPTL